MQTEILEVHEEGTNPFVSGPQTICCISALGIIR